MLGLGSGLSIGDALYRQDPFFEYNSDFTSSVDGWADGGSTEGGTISLAYNQSVGGEDGWLKVTYPATNQTNASSITNSNAIDATDEVGDIAVVNFKVYFLGDENTWSISSSNGVLMFFYVDLIGGSASFQNATLNQIESFKADFGKDADGSYGNFMTLFLGYGGDMPLANSVYYIKDINVKLYRT